LPADGEAVGAPHAVVQDHHVRGLAADLGERARAVLGQPDGVSRVPQQVADHAAQRLVVVREQDLAHPPVTARITCRPSAR
jgi:hypothetical protein